MRIWLAPSLFHPHRGGVEEVSGSLARNLRLQGFDVSIITNRHPRSLNVETIVEGSPVHRLAFPSPTRSLRGIASFAIESRACERRLAALPRPDLINIHCVSSQTPPLLRYARRHQIPLVVSTHGETEMDASRIYQRSRWIRSVFALAAERASILTACSRWTAERAALFAPRFADAEIVYNGIDAHEWRLGASPDAPTIGAWGRHVPQKGFDTLLAAFAQVRSTNPEARLLLGGDGPERAALERMAGDGVTFLGTLDRSGVKLLLAQVKVVAVPSRVEPFGIVALEALASGRALVYSDVGGLPEATGGIGVAVAARSIAGWAAALNNALSAPADVAVGIRRAARLDWPEVLPTWEALYERALRT